MKYPMKIDIRNIIHRLDIEALRTLAFELVQAIGHPRTCASLKVSEPMEDGTVIVGPSEEPCDCGADERVGDAFARTCQIHRVELGVAHKSEDVSE